MNSTNFKGIFTALITPFSKGAETVDLDAFSELIERQISAGIHGLVPCGTTGETPTLSDDEYKAVITRCIEVTAGRVPVIAGAGSNNTQKSALMARYARQQGADGLLVVAPYYNKPSQEGMIQHFDAVTLAGGGLPVIVYNIPGRSVVNIEQDTLKTLSENPSIIGVKDATGDLARPALTRISCGDDFVQLSGEDITIPAFLAQGGHGAISVASNIAPAQYVELYESWVSGQIDRFETLRDMLTPLADGLFMEPSPAPAKYALAKLGCCAQTLRLPLVNVTNGTATHLDDILENLPMESSLGHNVKRVG